MQGRKRKLALLYFILSLIALVLFAYEDGAFNHPKPESEQSVSGFSYPSDLNHKIVISDKARQHILYGDASGGGHKFGVGKPCKSEFPQNWDDNKILNTIQNIAANDNTNWRKEDNGYYVAEKYSGDIKVRVVLGREQKNIITAYPINVKRNPCPANDR